MAGRKVVGMMGAAVLVLAAVSAFATSHVRIVRLSYVDGTVQMDNGKGQGLERAILNSPVVEGARVVTGKDGLAEVEFEDNTAVRLGENTEVLFSQLLINDAGNKVNQVELTRGTMYFEAKRDKTDIDRVIAAGRTFILRHDSQVRFILSGDQVQAAVFGGEARLDNDSTFITVKKNETLTVDSNNPAGALVAKGVDGLPLDRWSNERAAYQTAYSYNNSGYGVRGMNGYGYSDLSYYGDWWSAPGYGMVWQPYGAFSLAGWNPYMSGAWVYAPGFGYAWSSAYPWGWLPYHYGAWSYLPTVGWFWCPGNSFANAGLGTNWQPTTVVTKGPVGFKPPTAPIPVASGLRPTVVVGAADRSMSYLPDGPIPPNFRSVITDHSGLVGTANPAAGNNGGSGASAANSKAASNMRSSAHQNSHVFASPPPSPSLMGGGYFPSASAGGSMHGSSGTSHASTGGHATPSAGHSSASPK